MRIGFHSLWPFQRYGGSARKGAVSLPVIIILRRQALQFSVRAANDTPTGWNRHRFTGGSTFHTLGPCLIAFPQGRIPCAGDLRDLLAV